MGYYYSLLPIKVVPLKHKLFLLLRWCRVNVETDDSSFQEIGLVMYIKTDLGILRLLRLELHTEMDEGILLCAMHLISKILEAVINCNRNIAELCWVFIACRLFSSCDEQGYSLFAVLWLLIEVASLVAVPGP